MYIVFGIYRVLLSTAAATLNSSVQLEVDFNGDPHRIESNRIIS